MRQKILLTVVFLALIVVGCRQNQPPRQVQASFHKKFPSVRSVNWEHKSEDDQWEAGFKKEGQKFLASFNNEGKWFKTETEISKDAIPVKVVLVLDRDYKDFELSKVSWIETPAFIALEIEMEKDESKIRLVIDKSGKILNEESTMEKQVSETDEKIQNEMTTGNGENFVNNTSFTDQFFIDSCTFSTTGKNRFFNLEPGFRLILKGIEGEDSLKLVITILDETERVGNIETRVMEEKEMENGEILEISRNFVAICKETSDIFYFGEEVDIYENGKLTGHGGAWRADDEDSKAGILMPGRILMGARYFQEISPGKAMDQAEILSQDEMMVTPAGNFNNCLKTLETSALNPKEKEFKYYAPGIGLIKEENLLLAEYGFIK